MPDTIDRNEDFCLAALQVNLKCIQNQKSNLLSHLLLSNRLNLNAGQLYAKNILKIEKCVKLIGKIARNIIL